MPPKRPDQNYNIKYREPCLTIIDEIVKLEIEDNEMKRV